MLKNIKTIEQLLKLEEGTLENAIKSEEEVEVSIPENILVMTKEEKEQRETNLKQIHEAAGEEMVIKKMRNEYGLDFQGKTVPNLLEAYGAKIKEDLTQEPDKRVDSLQSDLDIMKQNFQNSQEQVTMLNSQISQVKNESVINATISKAIPEPSALTIPVGDVETLFRAKHKLDVQEGRVVLMDGEEVMKNRTTLDPITLEERMRDFIAPYIKPTQGGAGGSDEPGAGGSETSFDSFIEEMEGQGINVGTEAFNREQAKRVANGTLKL